MFSGARCRCNDKMCLPYIMENCLSLYHEIVLSPVMEKCLPLNALFVHSCHGQIFCPDVIENVFFLPLAWQTTPGSEQGAPGVPAQDSKNMLLVQRLAGMDEAVLMAMLNAATRSQTVQVGAATVTAPADASIPTTTTAKVEENEVEHNADEDDEDEKADEDATKEVAGMKAKKTGMKANNKKKKAKKAGAEKARKAGADPKEEGATLLQLTAKTDEYIKKLGLTCAGTCYYEKAELFKINYSKGTARGSLTSKAKDKHDEAAHKMLHRKFHARAAAMK